MLKQTGNLRLVTIVLVLSLLSDLINGCKKETSYDQLKGYINTIQVINTHEHQRIPPQYEGHTYNFYTLLANSYLQADLVSAGAPQLDQKLIKKGDLDKLWEIYGPYLDYTRNTSYYSHFLQGFKTLYDFNDDYFTKDGIKALSEKIGKNYENQDEWYSKAFKKAGFEIMFVDQYWNSFNTNLDSNYFALVFNINQLVYSIADQESLSAKDASINQNIYKLAKDEGYTIKSLGDYLSFVDILFEIFSDHNAVCLKNSMAYGRSLDYEYIPYEEAELLYEKPSLSDVEKKKLQDFMFHWIIEKSIEVDLPIQIHTGYLAGTGNTLENGRPVKLNNLFLRYRKANFIMFHGGYPWTGEFAALGKMFPNVYLDIVWLPQISREAAMHSFDEMLDCV
ncbi:MAG: amidohydrolase family protein, partial [Bacteroidales bacterium]|nr:amidohydrolase family protein [Bacteroidales bacterium]